MSVTVRDVVDDDRAAHLLLDDVGFGADSDPEAIGSWRSLTSTELVACDGAEVVGAAIQLDLELTVPGGAVLPTGGVAGVVVAPTHRRRGILRELLTELHRRISDAGYPIAALTATQGGIYGRFGYGPATVGCEMSIDRRFAQFHPDAPDPGGVRIVRPADHRAEIIAIYDRWRRCTPGGLARPAPRWDVILADRENTRGGGTARFAFLHADGYALYRVHRPDAGREVQAEHLLFRAVTADAHAALWRALLGLDLVRTVSVCTYPDDPLPYLLSDPRLARTTARRDELWLRIMDVPAALIARGYRAELSTVLEVRDGFGSSGGRFALEVRAGRARCAPTDAPPEVEMDLDVLGSLYLGAHRASALAAANRLRTEDRELALRLDAVFASDVPAQLGFGF